MFYFDCIEIIDYLMFLQKHKDRYFRMKIAIAYFSEDASNVDFKRPGRITRATSASKLDLLDQLIGSFLIKESDTDFLKHQRQLVSEIQLDSDPSLIQIPFYAVVVRACALSYCILLCLVFFFFFFYVPTRSDLSCGETRVWRNLHVVESGGEENWDQ